MHICLYLYSSSEIIPLGLSILPSKSHGLSAKNAKCDKTPFKLLIVGVQETPKTVQAIILALACLPGVEGKFLLLNIPSILNIRLGGSKLNLTRKRLAED